MFRLARILSALQPCRIDQWLYVSDVPSAQPSSLTSGVVIRHFDVEHLSGNSSIDSKISRWRECYAAFVDDELAHQSWLRRDVLLPRRFGFSGTVPVIGDSHTAEAFRGRGLYPQVLQQICAEKASELCDTRDSATEKAQVYILVSPENAPSIRGIERAGFRRLARLQGWRVAGLIWAKQRHDA
ncbi:MAG: hypothetical protein KDA92_12605 [Planctomycetales bacterium]|nr:hypothetical protein [Planctomycetales bacterium]